MTLQETCCLIFLFFFIKGNAESAFPFLTAVIDAHVFDTDALCGKDRGEDGDGSRFIENIDTEGIIALDRTAAAVREGRTLFS